MVFEVKIFVLRSKFVKKSFFCQNFQFYRRKILKILAFKVKTIVLRSKFVKMFVFLRQNFQIFMKKLLKFWVLRSKFVNFFVKILIFWFKIFHFKGKKLSKISFQVKIWTKFSFFNVKIWVFLKSISFSFQFLGKKRRALVVILGTSTYSELRDGVTGVERVGWGLRQGSGGYGDVAAAARPGVVAQCESVSASALERSDSVDALLLAITVVLVAFVDIYSSIIIAL